LRDVTAWIMFRAVINCERSRKRKYICIAENEKAH
jgi:hypothetical protein